MSAKSQFWSYSLGLGLLLSPATNSALAQPPTSGLVQNSQFRRIEQPLSIKAIVTLAGLGLIGAELWWFLFSQTQARQAKVNRGVQEVDITVDGGYSPARVVVQSGQPLRLNFLRQDPSSCLEQVILPDFHQAVDLPLNQTTSVEFTPDKPGSYPFHCGMNMFRGVIEVQDNQS